MLWPIGVYTSLEIEETGRIPFGRVCYYFFEEGLETFTLRKGLDCPIELWRIGRWQVYLEDRGYEDRIGI
jgi:hypothetical protein